MSDSQLLGSFYTFDYCMLRCDILVCFLLIRSAPLLLQNVGNVADFSDNALQVGKKSTSKTAQQRTGNMKMEYKSHENVRPLSDSLSSFRAPCVTRSFLSQW
uniref:Uncharacterized protein n=1 Tax=Rhipicephalus microplus TaxID=6941 RepID=A0A6G5AGB1_RHIMP